MMEMVCNENSTIVVNASCCSDPRVTCKSCYELSQAVANYDGGLPLPPPVVNTDYNGQGGYWADGYEDAPLRLPPSINDLFDRVIEQPKPEPVSSFVINAPDEPLELPVTF